MRVQRILAVVFSLGAFVMAYFCYIENAYLGFPDGHKSELERVLSYCLPLYLALYLGFGSYFSYLGWKGKKNQLALVTFVVFTLVAYFTKPTLALFLDVGGGG